MPPSVRTTHVIEVHTARLQPGTDPEAFRAMNAAVLPAMLQAGLLRRELVVDPDHGLWTDILHWPSREHRTKALEMMMADPSLHAFMQHLDPASMVTVSMGDAVDLEAPADLGVRAQKA